MRAQEKYFEETLEIAKKVIGGQEEAIERAARIMEERVAGGGMVYTFGTGHGHLLALEMFYRAGGMVRVYPILDERLMLHIGASASSRYERQEGLAEELMGKYPMGEKDVLVAISNSGRNALPVEMAMLAKARGAFVIALTSLAYSKAVASRNKFGKRLFEVADLVLDNGGILGDALIEGSDGRRTGATSTAVGAMILQSVVARVHELALEKGDKVEFFASSNIDGGDAINEKLIGKMKPEIPFI